MVLPGLSAHSRSRSGPATETASPCDAGGIMRPEDHPQFHAILEMSRAVLAAEEAGDESLATTARLLDKTLEIRMSIGMPAVIRPHANAIAPAMSASAGAAPPRQADRHGPSRRDAARATRLSVSEVEPSRGQAAGRRKGLHH